MASSPYQQISPWMSYLEDTLLDQGEDGQQRLPDSGNATFQPFFVSFENGSPKGELGNLEKTNPRKRCSGTGGSKACREKMRRDRLNERFMELSAVLDPDKPIKSDKGVILADAVKVLSLLRFEARQLSASNAQLKEAIKELKAEKNELRDEKVRLKAEKEVLEQKMKAVTSSPGGGGGGYMPLSLAAFAPLTPKKAPMQGGGGLFEVPTMSDWLPSSTVDTSQDHILRPPVA